MGIVKRKNGWEIKAGGLELCLDGKTGVISSLSISGKSVWNWEGFPGGALVRDDRLKRTFSYRDIKKALFRSGDGCLTVMKEFHGAPWILEERYAAENNSLRWEASLSLETGTFRSCGIFLRLPLPIPIFPLSVWGATEKMPTKIHRHSELVLEYGDINSGISLPAVSLYSEKENAGLIMAMPFDFPVPLLRFRTSYREEYLQAEFDWLALQGGKPARTALLLKDTPGHWRPGLGWLRERFPEYFVPRSRLIHKLWGGTMGERPRIVTTETAKMMARLGLKWFNVHEHFPGYGNYHPEGMKQWYNRDYEFASDPPVTEKIVHTCIKNLHNVGAAAMPYIQVTGDGDTKTVAKQFPESQMRDRRGRPFSSWVHTIMMNGDISLPFGKDITRQIKGLLSRYPECDGVWFDQACYNFMDTAHSDGISAYENRPVYMGGFNYRPHLELLSQLLHPEKAIISNGPFGIGIMPYIDGVYAEGHIHFCEKYQYYCLDKPMFFYWPTKTLRDIEFMFQNCLLYGAGYFCSPTREKKRIEIYDRYIPLLSKLYRRQWVFDPDPVQVPDYWQYGIYRGEKGTLLVPLVNTLVGTGSTNGSGEVKVATAETQEVKKVLIHRPGEMSKKVPFRRENAGIIFPVPQDAGAVLAELILEKSNIK